MATHKKSDINQQEKPLSTLLRDEYQPKIDFLPEETDFVFEVAMPGFRRNDLAVNLQDNVLTIKGDRGRCISPLPVELIASESGFDCFEMKFHLAEGVCRAKIYAIFKSPVLSITFRKVAAQSGGKNRIIEIF